MRYIAVCLFLAVGVIALTFVAQGSRGRGASTPGACNCSEIIKERIEILATAVERHLGQPLQTASQSAEATGADVETAEAQRNASSPSNAPQLGTAEVDLEAIDARLAELERRLKEGVYLDPPPPHSLVTGAPPRNWSELDAFARIYRRSKEAAIDTVLFLGYSDILARFGKPTRVSDRNRWLYSRDRGTYGQDQAIEVELQFRGGYVIEASATLNE